MKRDSGLKCPICKGNVRVVEYPHGGGRIDCFKCGHTWHAFPIPGGVLMRKFPHPYRNLRCGQTSNAAVQQLANLEAVV